MKNTPRTRYVKGPDDKTIIIPLHLWHETRQNAPQFTFQLLNISHAQITDAHGTSSKFNEPFVGELAFLFSQAVRIQNSPFPPCFSLDM